MWSTFVKCSSIFEMQSMQLLCVIKYPFCIPEAVLQDCCSFNYSLILKDQRSLPQWTPCISLLSHTHTFAFVCTHLHGHIRSMSAMFSLSIPHLISCDYKGINVGLFKFFTEEPSMLFLILLLCEIFLYQPQACTSPEKGVIDSPVAWGTEHVLFSWSTFMSWCLWTCVCVYSRQRVPKCSECVFCAFSLSLWTQPILFVASIGFSHR